MTTDDLMGEYAEFKNMLDRLGVKYMEEHQNLKINITLPFEDSKTIFTFSIKDRYKLCNVYSIPRLSYDNCSIVGYRECD